MCYESGPGVEWLIEKFDLDLSLVARLGGHSQQRTHRGAERFPGMTITSAVKSAVACCLLLLEVFFGASNPSPTFVFDHIRIFPIHILLTFSPLRPSDSCQNKMKRGFRLSL